MTISIDAPDALGRLSVREGDHRRMIMPGRIEDGAFIPTDLVSEPEAVKAAALAAWTPGVVRAFQQELRASLEEPARSLQPLAPYQFRAMLKIAGIEQAVAGAIAAIEDDAQRAVAEAKLEYALSFQREDPLFDVLAPAVGLTDEEIDALWLQALSL